jgi:DNA-binding transcriptional LysR family regulator
MDRPIRILDHCTFLLGKLAMEMHQVRYFLAVARLLNFTRAAAECHVAQPSLTRAIKQLEEEFGGELFRRERNLTHLSDLGLRMRPMLQQCYDSALNAKTLAQTMKTGGIAPLSIGLSSAINITMLISFLTELVRAMPGLELRFSRGNSLDILELLKKGEVEVAVAGPLGEDWDRLDAWPLFTEPYRLAMSKTHRLAKQNGPLAAHEIAQERFLCRPYCEHLKELSDFFDQSNSQPKAQHRVGSDHDLESLIGANLGVAIAPLSAVQSASIDCLEIDDFGITRTVSVYGVAGRQRSAAASTLIKMLRAADWSSYEGKAGDLKAEKVKTAKSARS